MQPPKMWRDDTQCAGWSPCKVHLPSSNQTRFKTLIVYVTYANQLHGGVQSTVTAL